MAFVVLTAAAYLCGLQVPFMGPDEPRYAQVGREMLQSGDWLTPTLGGHPWFEKPPLLYWLELGGFHLFGVNEFAARLGPALFGLGTIATLWITGRMVSDRDAGNRLANLFALIAASTIGLIVFSHAASFDIILTGTLTAAVCSFFILDRRADLSVSKRWTAAALFYVLIGLSILAKGLIGFIFPFAIIAVYYLVSRRWPMRSFLVSLLWGLPLVLLVAAPWHVVMYQRYGSNFLDVYFVQNHFERFTSNRYLHPQPFFFYLLVLPVLTLPWLPFFLVQLWRGVRDLAGRVATPMTLFALSWLAMPVVFFSFSGSKLPGYVVPAVPAAVILAAMSVDRLAKRNVRWNGLATVIGGATLIAASISLLFVLPGISQRTSVRPLIDAANDRGYTSNRVLSLYLPSMNAEFYAAGRLRRDPNGNQLPLQGAQEVLPEIAGNGGRPVLVLIPLDAIAQFTDYKTVKTDVLAANDDFAIAAVSMN